jgi:aminobenzoyl-glutamate utilization protein B
VITKGGDQPNVVPRNASVWYFLRETEYPRIKQMREIADRIAKGAALMTDTEVSSRVIGSAWPQHFNRPVAEAMHANITAVGMPQWDAADQQLARAVQKELGQPERGLTLQAGPLGGAVVAEDNFGGGSDDIGDVSWTVPTVTIRYPSNIPGLPGHHWSAAVASATPIAHKGATAGAKAVAMTVVDLLLREELVAQAWDYFRTVQTKDRKYEPLLAPTDLPDTTMNAKTMEQYRPDLAKHYYDPTKYKTYLEQLGIAYPTVRN